MTKLKEFFEKNREIIIPTFTLFAICLVITLALGATNLLTADTIAALEKKTQNEAMSTLLPADEYATIEEGKSFCAVKDKETIGYVFITSQKGYGGDVSVMTAVNVDGSVKAVTVLAAGDETPGLGQNVTKENFSQQYTGFFGNVEVVKNGADKERNQINAVTGATISSRAVTRAVNEALELYKGIVDTAVQEVNAGE